MRFARWLALGLLAVGFAPLVPNRLLGDEGPPDPNAIADVPGALASLPAEGATLKFAAGEFKLPRGGHLQGVQLRFDAAAGRHVAFLSHDSETVAYLVVVEFPAVLPGAGRVIHVHEFPSDGQSPPLRHAGGMQLAGDVLAIGLEDNQQKTRSEIQFWDVSQPERPNELESLAIRRSGPARQQTAGAVGILRREKDHLLAVANWDSRAIDFYVSGDKPLADPRCRFGLQARWQDAAAEKSDWQPDRQFAPYQAVNLLADAKQNVFLVGFATEPAGRDVVDLFSVDISQPPGKLLRKLARKPIALAGENHFVYAGGAWIHKGRMSILSSPRELARETTLNIIPGRGE